MLMSSSSKLLKKRYDRSETEIVLTLNDISERYELRSQFYMKQIYFASSRGRKIQISSRRKSDVFYITMKKKNCTLIFAEMFF